MSGFYEPTVLYHTPYASFYLGTVPFGVSGIRECRNAISKRRGDISFRLTLMLFEDYVKGNEYKTGEPYQLFEYYREKNKKHLMELLPQAYGFNQYNENPKTEIYLTNGEEMDGKVYNQQNKPLITFQPFGGLPPGVQPNRMKADSSQRDMPLEFASKIVRLLIQKGFKVLQIRGQSEMPIQNTLQLNLPFRNLLPISKHSVAHIGIDSAMMHGAAIFEKPQLIFWAQTHKDNLGYKYEGFFNAYNKNGMHCRPHVQLPDRKGAFPYKDKKEGLEFEYTDAELNKHINKFIEYIKK